MERTESTDIKQAKRASGNPTKPVKQKNKYPGFCKNCIDYSVEFTENTSLHGVRYMGEKKRNIIEKIWWLVVFIVSLYLCIKSIIKTYQKWENSPVIVNFARSPTPVWQIPFPAVTICPENKSRQSVFNFTYYYHKMMENPENLTKDEYVCFWRIGKSEVCVRLKQFQDIALLCDHDLYHEGNDTVDNKTIDFLFEVAPQLEEMISMCKWIDFNEACDTLFTPILTDEGVCYTFNMLDKDDIYRNEVYHNRNYLNHGRDRYGWSLEDGYQINTAKDTFPRRSMSVGTKAGLMLLMKGYDYDLDYICRDSVQGFKMLLHHPGEVPRFSSQYFHAHLNHPGEVPKMGSQYLSLPLKQEIVITVTPDMMTTSKALRDYDPLRRQCYYSWERTLRFYKHYTQQNCDVECLTNFTLATCGCVAYHMPHDEATDVCGSGKIGCQLQAEGYLLASQVTTELSHDFINKDALKHNIDCNCLPACTSLSYNAETSLAEFNWPALFKAFGANISEFPGLMLTRVSIALKQHQFVSSTRNELYGITDFMADCGGLVGLFIGFSFLSLMETIYFLTLRLVCNIRRHGRHYWSGSPDLINNDAYLHTQ